ncbi:MAG: AAA family ATPase [Desulfuromonas sp.]|nr:AAA family ATPase [Desulfuromonas sp.]
MYLSHFNLREAPFSLTPDPDFFYGYAGHQEALNVLLVALQGGEGFLKITGEVGTGKTLLCRKLLSALGEGFRTAYLPNPLLTPFELHKALAQELALKTPADATLHDLVKRITEALVVMRQHGRKAVLCIDEAQAMPAESLEALRLLSNLETEKQKLLQIVVFAQPEFNVLVQGTDLRQLRQRITFSYELPPLDRAGVDGYVKHRLRVAGYGGGQLFSPAALDAISTASRGIPRLVNILCHKALMAAYGQGVTAIDPSHAAAAIRDTEDALPARCGFWDEPLHRWLGAATAIEAVLLLWLLWSALA